MGNNIINNMVFLPPITVRFLSFFLTFTSETQPRKVVYIRTKTGKRIPAYYIPCKNPNVNTTVIYSHGNAADIGSMNEFLYLLSENLPINILHYEYIGYGLAKDQGKPSESNTYESIEAGLTYLVNSKGFNYEDIIAFGTSVGSGPTLHLVSKYRRLRGLVLECPFTSCCRVVIDKHKFLASILEKTVDMFVNVSKIDKVVCPVLIFHGTSDSVVPFSHGVELWDKVNKDYKYQKVWIKDADHHDIIEKLSPKVYIQYLYDFINFCEENMKKRRKNGFYQALENDIIRKSNVKNLFSCGSNFENQIERVDDDNYEDDEDESDDEVVYET